MLEQRNFGNENLRFKYADLSFAQFNPKDKNYHNKSPLVHVQNSYIPSNQKPHEKNMAYHPPSHPKIKNMAKLYIEDQGKYEPNTKITRHDSFQDYNQSPLLIDLKAVSSRSCPDEIAIPKYQSCRKLLPSDLRLVTASEMVYPDGHTSPTKIERN